MHTWSTTAPPSMHDSFSPRGRAIARESLRVVFAGVLLTSSLLPFMRAVAAPSPEGDTTVRFDVEQHLPPVRFYLRFTDISSLRAGFQETALYQILTRDDVQEAFAQPLAEMRAGLAEAEPAFLAWTGKKPLEILDLFRGEFLVAVGEMTPMGIPELCFAIELGAQKAEIRKLVRHAAGMLEQALGVELQKYGSGAEEAMIWPTPAGAVFEKDFGSHLVFTNSARFFGEVSGRYFGKSTGESFGGSPLRATVQKGAPVKSPHVELGLDLAWLNQVIAPFVGAGEEARWMQFLGVHDLSVFGAALRLTGGMADRGYVIQSSRANRGILGILGSELKPVGATAREFTHVPPNALSLGGLRIDVDPIVARAKTLAEELGLAQAAQGLANLPRLGEFSLRTASVPDPDQPGNAIDCYFMDTAMFRRVLPLVEQFVPLIREKDEGGTELVLLDFEQFDASLSGTGFVGTDLGDGTSVVAGSRTILDSILEHRTKARRKPDERLGRDAMRLLSRAPFASTGIDRGQALAALRARFDTPDVRQGLGSMGVNTELLPSIDELELPPVRYFTGAIARPDRLRLRARSRIVSVYAADLFTPVFVGVGVLVPSLSAGREEAFKVACSSNLKHIYAVSLLYALRTKTDRFPHDPAGSLASIQKLVDYFPEDFQPKTFICPAASHEPVHFAEDGAFKLTREACSYEMVPWQMKATTPNSPLMYDRHPHHDGGRMVLYSDGSVIHRDEATFQAQLAEARKRFEGKEDGKDAGE